MQADLAFPQSLAEKYRPVRIADFIGLERPKKVLSAFCKRPASGAWLFVGPSGVGKSTMALALATELAAELHKIPSQKCNAQSIEDTVRQCWYAPMAPGGFNVVLANEADQMTNAAQLALLSKLDSTDPAPNTIWIFTANDTERLERRFLSRCKVLEFSSYGLAAEIVSYLDHIWHAEGGNGNGPDLARLAKDSLYLLRSAGGAWEGCGLSPRWGWYRNDLARRPRGFQNSRKGFLNQVAIGPNRLRKSIVSRQCIRCMVHR